jgi:23S rRNA pseudouridine2605 synthase
MRLNKYIALATGMSRRAADDAITKERIHINNALARLGQPVDPEKDAVSLDGKFLTPPEKPATIMLNKPVGYVCSRDGQGSKTVYDLLPAEYHQLKPVGRLDKDSSGLLLLTNDGTLAYELTHPSFHKMKVYELRLDKPLTPPDWEHIATTGVKLSDGSSKFELKWLHKNDGLQWLATLHEGRNRQIRRTFEALGYKVTKLHRTRFGPYILNPAHKSGEFKTLDQEVASLP